MKVSPKNQFFLLLFIYIISRLVFIYLNPEKVAFEQDEYLYYASSILNGEINQEEFPLYSKRLMPGYPLMMIGLLPLTQSLLLSGFIISFLSAIGSILLLFKITKSKFVSIIYAVFPPIWIEQSVKISTEPITSFFLLLAILIYINKKYFLSGLIIGLAFDIRIISIFLFFSLGFIELLEKRFSNILKLISGFLLPVIFLFIFNYSVFGINGIFEQFVHGESYGGVRIGILQLVDDILRTIDWGQYRILFSGSFYILISFIGIYFLFKNRRKSKVLKILFYWALFSTIFVFSASPFTFIENYSRYSLPYYSAIILGLVLCVNNLGVFKNIKRRYKQKK